MSDREVFYSLQGPESRPAKVIFIWPAVSKGRTTITFRVTIDAKGDFREIIDTVKQAGGLWQKDDFGGDWFLGWPPMAILVASVSDHPIV